MMTKHMENRRRIIQALREELVGPSPQGNEIDCSGEIKFSEQEESYGPWKQKGNGEEILLRDTPVKRYGVGVLYPLGAAYETAPEEETAAATAGNPEVSSSEDPLTSKGLKDIEEIEKRSERGGIEPDVDDFDLTTANAYQPSSMAISFLAEFPEGSELVVEASGGRYRSKIIEVQGEEYTWWLRSPVSIVGKVNSCNICSSSSASFLCLNPIITKNNDDMDIRLEVFSRPRKGEPESVRLLTVCLINRTEKSVSYNERCLFQSHFKVHIDSHAGNACILPYPRPPGEYLDEEEYSLNLLYRNVETYAVGHGCAADWGEVSQNKAGWVSAECLPGYQTPSVTPEIKREDGTPVEIPMAVLAGLIKGENGFDALAEIIELYEKWIGDKRKQILQLDFQYRPIAEKHMRECSRCTERMRDGLKYLKENSSALRAFQLANHAVLLQQIRSRCGPRLAQYDKESARIIFLRHIQSSLLNRPTREDGERSKLHFS
jgi:hypothetical protein